ncbi:MAG: transporter, partial [Phycisphaerales bacterium]|nr:transporter [Phycisphaerales bacterium]
SDGVIGRRFTSVWPSAMPISSRPAARYPMDQCTGDCRPAPDSAAKVAVPALPVDHPARMRSAPSPRVALILLLSINLMNYVDRQILSALEKPIGEEFHVGTELTGWLPTAFLLAYMVFAPIFGVLADRTSRWLIIGGGVIAWSLASGGSGLATAFWMLLMMRLLIGVGEAAYGPVAPTLIADLYPVADRGRVLAWFYAAIPVGSAIGYVIGGQFHAHWHWAFYLTLPPGVALGVWALLLRDPRHEGRKEVAARTADAAPVIEKTTPSALDDEAASVSDAPPVLEYAAPRARKDEYLALLHVPSYVWVTLGMTAMTFALGGIAYFMPRWLEGRGQEPGHATFVFGVISASAGLVATLAGGWLGDKLRTRFSGSYFLVSGIGMLVAFPMFLLMLISPFPLCWVVLFATVFCLFLNTGPSNAVIANVTAPAVRATAFAANIFMIHLLGDAISPPIIGYVASRFGHTGADGKFVDNLDAGFLVVSVAMLLGGIFWIIGAPHLAKDTAAAERLEAAI